MSGPPIEQSSQTTIINGGQNGIRESMTVGDVAQYTGPEPTMGASSQQFTSSSQMYQGEDGPTPVIVHQGPRTEIHKIKKSRRSKVSHELIPQETVQHVQQVVEQPTTVYTHHVQQQPQQYQTVYQSAHPAMYTTGSTQYTTTAPQYSGAQYSQVYGGNVGGTTYTQGGSYMVPQGNVGTSYGTYSNAGDQQQVQGGQVE